MDDHTADGAGGPGAPSESPRAEPAAGELVTETLDYDGGRQVTRVASHGAALWQAEFPLMVEWAFGR
jgi:hypothetical protein